MFYLTTHSTHFIYGYMASDIWCHTIQIAREETHCHHMGYSFRLTARVLLYAASHRQDNTYHGLCYTSRGALAGTSHTHTHTHTHTHIYIYIHIDIKYLTFVDLFIPRYILAVCLLSFPWSNNSGPAVT